MNLISKWIMSIVGAAALLLLVDIIMPEGGTKKYIRSVMSIITLFIILSPLPGLLNKDWRIDNLLFDTIKPDNRIVDTVYNQQISLLEESLENKLSEEGYKNAQINITGYQKDKVLKIKAVSVNVSKCGLTQSEYEKIKQKIKTYLDDNNVMVILYG